MFASLLVHISEQIEGKENLGSQNAYSVTRDSLADGGGFEPPGRGRRPLVFKTSSFGRSDNHPDEVKVYPVKPSGT